MASVIPLRISRSGFRYVTEPSFWSLEEGMPFPQVRIERRAKGQKHPTISCLRDIMEKIAFDYASARISEGQSVVDVGSNPDRYVNAYPAECKAGSIRFVMPNIMDGDVGRRERMERHIRDGKVPSTSVLFDALNEANCAWLKQSVAVFVHSAYYFNPSLMWSVLANAKFAVVVEHVFQTDFKISKTKPGMFYSMGLNKGEESAKKRLTGKLRIEMTATKNPKGNWVCRAKGNKYAYTHPVQDYSEIASEYTIATFSPLARERIEEREKVVRRTWARVIRYDGLGTPRPEAKATPLDRTAIRMAGVAPGLKTPARVNFELAKLGNSEGLSAQQLEQAAEEVIAKADCISAKVTQAMATRYVPIWDRLSGFWDFLLPAGLRNVQRNYLIGHHLSRAEGSGSTAVPWKPILAASLCLVIFIRQPTACLSIAGAFISSPADISRFVGSLPQRLRELVPVIIRGLADLITGLKRVRGAKASASMWTALGSKPPVVLACPMLKACSLPPNDYPMMVNGTAKRVIDPRGEDWTGAPLARDEYCEIHSPGCDAEPAVAYTPAGLMLPVDANVFHTCTVTQSRAVVERVLRPPVDTKEPEWWVEMAMAGLNRDAGGFLDKIDVSDVEWYEQHTGEKKTRKLEGGSKDLIPGKRSLIVKSELTGKGTVPAESSPFGSVHNHPVCAADPRPVISNDGASSALFGPTCLALSKFLKDRFDGEKHTLPGVRVAYAVGYNGDEQGQLHDVLMGWVGFGGTRKVSRVPTDNGRFDARVPWFADAHCINFTRCLARMPIHSYELWLRDAVRTKLHTRFLGATWLGRRRSGDDWTTVFNTWILMTYARRVGVLFHQRTGTRLAAKCGGDDGCWFVETDHVPAFLEILQQVAGELNWVVEPELTEFPGFYSGLYVPLVDPISTSRGVTTTRLMPKPGRAWVKASMCTQNLTPENVRKWLGTNAIANYGVWTSIPVLRTLVNAWKISTEEPKYLKKHNMYANMQIVSVNWDYWTEYFGQPREVIEDFERRIAYLCHHKMVLTLDFHPMVRSLVKDCDFPVSDEAQQFVGVGWVHTPGGRLPQLKGVSFTPLQGAYHGFIEELLLSCAQRLHPSCGAGAALGVFLTEAYAMWRSGRAEWIPFKLVLHGLLFVLRLRWPLLALAFHTLWDSWVLSRSPKGSEVSASLYACAIHSSVIGHTTQTTQIEEMVRKNKRSKRNSAVRVVEHGNQPVTVTVGKQGPGQSGKKRSKPKAAKAARGQLGKSLVDNHPDTPSAQALYAALSDPWNAEKVLAKMGKSLNAMRFPSSPVASSISKVCWVYEAICAANDDGGAYGSIITLYPFLKKALLDSLSGSAGSFDNPNAASFASIAAAMRVYGFGVTVTPDPDIATSRGRMAVAQMPAAGALGPQVNYSASPATALKVITQMPGAAVGKITTPLKFNFINCGRGTVWTQASGTNGYATVACFSPECWLDCNLAADVSIGASTAPATRTINIKDMFDSLTVVLSGVAQNTPFSISVVMYMETRPLGNSVMPVAPSIANSFGAEASSALHTASALIHNPTVDSIALKGAHVAGDAIEDITDIASYADIPGASELRSAESIAGKLFSKL